MYMYIYVCICMFCNVSIIATKNFIYIQKRWCLLRNFYIFIAAPTGFESTGP